MYIKSGTKFIENRIKRGLPVDENWNTGEKYYKWWVTKGRKQIAQVDGQTEWGD
jgi:hypothetical protein